MATVYLVPVTFGFGPAALATAVARELRIRHPDLRLVGVGDGIAFDFLRTSGVFDGAVAQAPPGALPDQVGGSGPAVAACFVDFDRLAVARERGLPTLLVDPVYWMWDREPMDPADTDRYLALAFPGVAERVAARRADGREITVVSQVVDPALPAPAGTARQRAGVIVNLGGAMAPIDSNHGYLRALVDIVADAVGEGTDLLVTASAGAAERINALPSTSGVRVSTLPFDAMMSALATRARLLTLPGQSIMWEALRMAVPTVVLPGANYSHHRQVGAYERYFANVGFVTWDDLDGYGTLPPGLREDDGTPPAVELGRRFTADAGARRALTGRIAAELRRPAVAPALRPGHPWAEFDGAAQVADEIAALCAARLRA